VLRAPQDTGTPPPNGNWDLNISEKEFMPIAEDAEPGYQATQKELGEMATSLKGLLVQIVALCLPLTSVQMKETSGQKKEEGRKLYTTESSLWKYPPLLQKLSQYEMINKQGENR